MGWDLRKGQNVAPRPPQPREAGFGSRVVAFFWGVVGVIFSFVLGHAVQADWSTGRLIQAAVAVVIAYMAMWSEMILGMLKDMREEQRRDRYR